MAMIRATPPPVSWPTKSARSMPRRSIRRMIMAEKVAPVGIAVAEEIWRDDAGSLGKPRDHLVVEKRPGGNSVQQDDRRAVAEVGPRDPKRFVAQPFQLGRFLPLPESVMGERRRRATGRHDPAPPFSPRSVLL